MLMNALTLMAMLAFAPIQDTAPIAEAVPPAEAALTAEAPSAAELVLSPIPEIADDELILGEADAPDTLIVYSSLVCVQCARWHTEGLPQMIANQIASGTIRLVTRFVPTAPGQLAGVAAGIVRCSVKENQMNVAGAFFENQAALRDGSMTAMDWQLAGVAASGRTQDEVVACLNEPATMLAVSATSDAAAAAGLQGVPTFFLNGVTTSDSFAPDEAAETEETPPASSPTP